MLATVAVVVSGPAGGSPRHEMAAIAGPAVTIRIDRHEVSVGQFVVFAAVTGLTTKAELEGGGFQYLGGWQRMPGWNRSAP